MGSELLFAAVGAYPFLASGRPPRLAIFTGPFLDEEAFQRLLIEASGYEKITVSRFSGDFLDLLAGADLSLSLAGYNTTMNVLAAGVPALVWPFAQNQEQSMRAGRLSELGLLGILFPEDMNPARLAGRVSELLSRGRRVPPKALGLDGAAESARLIAAGATGALLGG